MGSGVSDLSLASGPGARPALELGWALLRVPVLLVLLFVFRHPILNLVESAVDIVQITRLAIDLFSTPVSRALLAFVSFWLFMAAAMTTLRLKGLPGYVLAVGASVLIAALLFKATQSSARWILLIGPLLALSWFTARDLPQLAPLDAAAERIVRWAPGLGEALFAPRWAAWTLSLARGRPVTPDFWLRHAPGAAVAAIVMAAMTAAHGLVPLERALRSGPDVRVVAQGDFNGLALEAGGERLFVTGHGVANVLAFRVSDWAAPAQESADPTNGAQALAYVAETRELHLFDLTRRTLVTLDSDTLQTKRTRALPELSPGDPWIALDPRTQRLTLASEADERTGAPLVVLAEAGAGAVLARRPEDVGNVMLHPRKSWIYMSYFRRGSGVLALDLETLEIVARAEADERTDRLAFHAARNEVLVASPVEGRLLRYDADTLDPRGALRAPFGVRVIAIDEARRVALVGSLTTGAVALLDLETGRALRSWYVGPWLRSIELNPAIGRAYISSNGALYELDYAVDR